MPALRVVVMGVAGSGKSTVAAGLARLLGARCLEGDDLHPAANVTRMAAGWPLGDADRWPWLAALRRAMREEPRVVASCSALRRSYRDMLRGAGDVVFVHLAVEPEEAARRLSGRRGHFMRPGMLDSQLRTLEPPGADETDVATVPGAGRPAAVLAAVHAAVGRLRPGTAVAPLQAVGSPTTSITRQGLDELVEGAVDAELTAAPLRRVLIVPPDGSRRRSRAGEIAGLLLRRLARSGCDAWVLPATGTHHPMSGAEIGGLLEGRVPEERVLTHRWRTDLVELGEIGAGEVGAVSGDRVRRAIPIAVSRHLLEGWDLVVSVGQVVPHEVVGMANFTKNLVVGLGGAATIDGTHFLGAMCGMETIMGRARTPVRDLVDAAFDRLLAPRLRVTWMLTVVEDRGDAVVQRGLYAGRGGSGDSGGAAYRAAAALSAACNITALPRPLDRAVCWMDPGEFTSTWVANKAIYRTRMALAGGAELVVLAPGVRRFGEHPVVDRLIRAHGYRGTAATLRAVESGGELAAGLGVAAHLIHGSSEGRFRIVYCTDPDRGGLSQDEVEGAGYAWRHLTAEIERLDLGEARRTGPRLDRDGAPYHLVANPALGLWTSARSEAGDG